MKNKKRGVALLSTVVLMVVVITFSILIFTLIANSNATGKVNESITKKEILSNRVYADFTADGEINEEYDLDLNIYTNQDNSNIKAVVAKKQISSKNIYFMVVYDFENNQVIARQLSNFELSIKDVDGELFYYLPGNIKYERV